MRPSVSILDRKYGATFRKVAILPVKMEMDGKPAAPERRRYSRHRHGNQGKRSRGRAASVGLLASTPDLSFSVLDVEESFKELSPEKQLRLYYVSRAVCEAQKITFLQSSPETPAILLLFQELFCSPEETHSPGELILELQKTWVTKESADAKAISEFYKYVVLFYHNFGNYNLRTGEKIFPDCSSNQFEAIVQSSRAFVQHRGRRLQHALDRCLKDIYAPAGGKLPVSRGPRLSPPNSDDGLLRKEAKIIDTKEYLMYPFYCGGVSFFEMERVDKELDAKGIPKVNTRIIKEIDGAKRTIFHVLQACVRHDSTAHIGPQTKVRQFQSVSKRDQISLLSDLKPDEVITMANQDQIRIYPNDYSYLLSRLISFLTLAQNVQGDAGESTRNDFAKTVEAAVEAIKEPSSTTWTALHEQGLASHSCRDNSIVFLVTSSELLPHRDPMGSRGMLESYVALQNSFYQSRVDNLVRERAFLLNAIAMLPLHHLMKNFEERLRTVSVTCIDLILRSGPGRAFPLLSNLYVDEAAGPQARLLFITNVVENYGNGLLTNEKRHILEGVFADEDAALVEDEWERVAFLRFFLEEVVVPCTMVTSRGGISEEHKTSVMFPSEIFVNASDEEQCEVESDSDSDVADDESRQMLRFDAAEVMKYSSIAKVPKNMYAANETYASKFGLKLANVLEECRVVLASLALALTKDVRHHTCGSWRMNYDATPEDTDDGSLSDVALVYVLLILRDGLLSLPFFSTQEFRWEDEKMLARFMVMQMLSYECVDITRNAQAQFRALSSPVAKIVPTTQRNNRDLEMIHLGVDDVQILALQVGVITDSFVTSDHEKRSWRYRLRVIVRGWVQHVQWIQLTGDVDSGQRLYDHFGRLSSDHLRFREFVMLRLGCPDTRQREAELAGNSSGRKASVVKRGDYDGVDESMYPVMPAQSMEVRNRLLAIRNPSYYGPDTIWISPFLRLVDSKDASSRSALQAAKQTHLQKRQAGVHPKIQRSRDSFDVTSQQEADPTSHGSIQIEHSESPHSNHESSNASSDLKTLRVELRTFPADLSCAIESAVLNVGIITDDEIAQLWLR